MSQIELAIIMPVYNEEGIIKEVLETWHNMAKTLNVPFEIHPYNDGSKDNTKTILDQVATERKEIIPHHKPNSGHGSTILQGYRENCKHATWVFQTDSDNEMPADFFPELWKQREDNDFLLGRRSLREQPLPRKIVSAISRMVVWTFYSNKVWDVNSPYRLMRAEKFEPIFNKIPHDTFAPNVIISGMAGVKKLRIQLFNIPHQNRETGEVSIKKWKLFKAALRSFGQTIRFRFS